MVIMLDRRTSGSGDAGPWRAGSVGHTATWTPGGSLRGRRRLVGFPGAGGVPEQAGQLLSAGACVPAYEWLIARPDAGVARSSGSLLPVGVVDDLDVIVGRLRRMDDQLGGATLLPLVRATLRQVQNSLGQRRYSDAVGRR